MNGAIPPLPLYVFTAFTRTTLTYTVISALFTDSFSSFCFHFYIRFLINFLSVSTTSPCILFFFPTFTLPYFLTLLILSFSFLSVIIFFSLLFRCCFHFYPLLYLLFCLHLPLLPFSLLHLLVHRLSIILSTFHFLPSQQPQTQSNSLFISYHCIRGLPEVKGPVSSHIRHDAALNTPLQTPLFDTPRGSQKTWN